MEFFKEAESLIKSISQCLIAFFFLALFFFAFGIKQISLFNLNVFLPVPARQSFAVLFFEQIQKDLVPAGVEMIVISPLSAFLAQAIISLGLALVIGSPFFIYQFIKYLSPVFSHQEKSKIIKVWIPSIFLFITGCVFAYFLLIPTTLNILYEFPIIMGITPFFVVDEFVMFVLGMTLVSGIMFLLPILMVLLSWFDIIKKDFWRNHWRYAASIFLIFSAIITPDGSGVTMLMLSLPLSGLYFLGYCLILE